MQFWKKYSMHIIVNFHGVWKIVHLWSFLQCTLCEFALYFYQIGVHATHTCLYIPAINIYYCQSPFLKVIKKIKFINQKNQLIILLKINEVISHLYLGRQCCPCLLPTEATLQNNISLHDYYYIFRGTFEWVKYFLKLTIRKEGLDVLSPGFYRNCIILYLAKKKMKWSWLNMEKANKISVVLQ